MRLGLRESAGGGDAPPPGAQRARPSPAAHHVTVTRRDLSQLAASGFAVAAGEGRAKYRRRGRGGVREWSLIDN